MDSEYKVYHWAWQTMHAYAQLHSHETTKFHFFFHNNEWVADLLCDVSLTVCVYVKLGEWMSEWQTY